MTPVIIAIVAVVVVIGIWFVSIYNGIVTRDNRCDNAWQTIDAQLQRRNDLIPNLVNTVKGYAAHESETLQAVTNARAAVANAPTPEAAMDADNQLTQAIGRLFAVAEAYPELKANSNFAQLQADLTDTENKISYARMSFNDCVLEYNNAIQTFPGNLVETVKGYAAHESGTLQAVTQARAAVTQAGTPEEKMEASNQLSGTLKTLFAVAESYPDLKANTNFQELQAELSDTENKISYARQSFNDCVLDYNNAIETFPGNIVAGSKFRTRQGFEVTDAAARQAPQVKF